MIDHLKLVQYSGLTQFFLFERPFSLMFFITLTYVVCPQLLAQSVVERHGRLQVQGSKIEDKDDAPVSLAGNSLFRSNAADMQDFGNRETVNHLADEWNSSIILAAMGVNEPWDGGNGYIRSPELQEAKVQKVIDAAIEKEIYVIIDWHTHEVE